jgi:hypothetical protein
VRSYDSERFYPLDSDGWLYPLAPQREILVARQLIQRECLHLSGTGKVVHAPRRHSRPLSLLRARAFRPAVLVLPCPADMLAIALCAATGMSVPGPLWWCTLATWCWGAFAWGLVAR